MLFFAVLTAVFAVAMTALPFLNTQTGDVLGFSSSITASDVVERTNAERQKVGLAPLKVNSALTQAAQAKATHMFAHQYWAHSAPDGTQPWAFFKTAQYNYSVAGENLARDFMNAPEMMDAWMSSPTHKANIVNQKYQEIGIGVLNGELNGVETTLVVQFFGTPMAIVPNQPRVAAVQTDIPSVDPSPADERAAGQADINLGTLAIEQQQPTVIELDSGDQAEVLSSFVSPLSQLRTPPLFSPLQLRKSLFLAIILVIVVTLFYDMLVTQHKQNARLVGKNLAHISFLIMIAFLVIYFKSGVIQ